MIKYVLQTKMDLKTFVSQLEEKIKDDDLVLIDSNFFPFLTFDFSGYFKTITARRLDGLAEKYENKEISRNDFDYSASLFDTYLELFIKLVKDNNNIKITQDVENEIKSLTGSTNRYIKKTTKKYHNLNFGMDSELKKRILNITKNYSRQIDYLLLDMKKQNRVLSLPTTNMYSKTALDFVDNIYKKKPDITKKEKDKNIITLALFHSVVKREKTRVLYRNNRPIYLILRSAYRELRFKENIFYPLDIKNIDLNLESICKDGAITTFNTKNI